MKSTITNILKSNKIFYLLLSIVGIWHLWSLLYSPIPWHDETFYASISKSLIEGKGFTLEVWPFKMQGKEVLIYGPIYFLLTGLSFSLFGFGIFQFRIVALVFSALSIYVFGNILKQLNINKSITRLFILLLAFDVIVIQNGHSGRMDMVALFFALAAWLAYLKGQTQIKYVWLMAIAGAASILITPRIAVIIFPLFIYALIQFLKTKNWFQTAIITLLPTLIYYIWIVYAFGSLAEFFEYFSAKSNSNSVSLLSYLGGRLYIPFYQWPLILTAIISTVIIILNKTKIQILLLLGLPILTFYIIVADTGAYSALIMPFWYLIIALALANCNANKKIVRVLLYSGVVATLFVNVGIFSVKAATIVGSQTERNPHQLQTWVNEHIPKNSKIVGDNRYYYACIKNNCDFQYIEGGNNHSVIVQYYLNNYQPIYLFISTQTPKELLAAYNKEYSFLEQWEYIPQKGNPLIANSGSIRTPVLETFGQPFRKHPDTCSGIIRTLILETSGH